LAQFFTLDIGFLEGKESLFLSVEMALPDKQYSLFFLEDPSLGLTSVSGILEKLHQ
jgi:hypothetical protein